MSQRPALPRPTNPIAEPLLPGFQDAPIPPRPRTPVTPAVDRRARVLQPSRTPTQLSLFSRPMPLGKR